MNFGSTDEELTNTEKLNFDFLINIESQRLRFMKILKNIKLDHQELTKSRDSIKSQSFQYLEKFQVFLTLIISLLHDKFSPKCKMIQGKLST